MRKRMALFGGRQRRAYIFYSKEKKTKIIKKAIPLIQQGISVARNCKKIKDKQSYFGIMDY